MVFEFSVMRCQPLRWALCLNDKNQLVVLSISLAFRSFFSAIQYCLSLPNEAAMCLAL